MNKPLREIRKEAGLKQIEVAAAIGIRQSTYSYIETGKRYPSIKTAQKLAKILNCTIDELLVQNKETA